MPVLTLLSNYVKNLPPFWSMISYNSIHLDCCLKSIVINDSDASVSFNIKN